MEQLQKASPKPTHFVSSGPQTYNILRMSTHKDKIPDKLLSSSSSSNKTPKGKQSERNVERSGHDNRQLHTREKRNVPRQDQNLDNNFKNRQQKNEQEQKTSTDQEQEYKVDNRYSLGQDNVQDNRYDVNRLHQREVLRPEIRFNFSQDGKNSASQKDEGNQLKKDDFPEKKDNEKGDTNPFSDSSSEEVVKVQSEESSGGVGPAVPRDVDVELPSTAILLTTKGGSKVYVVGTVHFSVESQVDVANVIRAVRPDYVVIELCLSRAYMLQWNEEHILKEAQQLSFKAMKQVIQRAGLVQGGLYLLMLSLTIQITKQLGIAPGGEFRTAYREALNIPHSIVWFGDRPLEITLHRMLASLSIWQMTKLFFVVLFKSEKISKEEVEKCKNSDVLERMMLSISKELPDFANVILNERDLYLTYSLQVAAERSEPNTVVGVVGIGHLAGIEKNWGKVTADDIHKILAIPPPRKSARIIKFVFKFAAVGLVVYGAHRLASKCPTYSNLFSDQSYWNLSNMMYDIWDSPVIQT